MKRRSATIVVIVVLGLGLVGLAAGFGGRWGSPAAQEDRPDMHRLYMEALAERLGIGVDELERIMLEARMQLIDETLAAGQISEVQAQWMKERLTAEPEEWQPRMVVRPSRMAHGRGGCRGHWMRPAPPVVP